MFAEESDFVAVVKILAPILSMLAVGVFLWLKADAAEKTARTANDKSDASHVVVRAIEQQTNSRLHLLDQKVVEQDKLIEELKLALALAQAKLKPKE